MRSTHSLSMWPSHYTCLVLGLCLTWGTIATAQAVWNYDDPTTWAGTCATGTKQSPVNISQKKTLVLRSLDPLIVNYRSTDKVDLENDEKGWMITFPDGSYMISQGKRYNLNSARFHAPSEHTLDGVQYPMELQYYHTAPEDGQPAIVSVLMEYGEELPFLSAFWDSIPNVKGKVTADVRVDPIKGLPGNLGHYSFTGSITTPPCTEGVRWIVMQTPHFASYPQVAALKAALPAGQNSRPTQPLGDRTILSTYIYKGLIATGEGGDTTTDTTQNPGSTVNVYVDGVISEATGATRPASGTPEGPSADPDLWYNDGAKIAGLVVGCLAFIVISQVIVVIIHSHLKHRAQLHYVDDTEYYSPVLHRPPSAGPGNSMFRDTERETRDNVPSGSGQAEPRERAASRSDASRSNSDARERERGNSNTVTPQTLHRDGVAVPTLAERTAAALLMGGTGTPVHGPRDPESLNVDQIEVLTVQQPHSASSQHSLKSGDDKF
eukprot:GFYU01005107.1.p1 GENE.GFYU01005107.1~~GFYU01005107.1.p1  ORF type:complete len:568 (+),score=76.02 GFYU01005107.1:226-1704(+)